MSPLFARRSFLHALGLGAGALATSTLWTPRSYAAPGKAPKRILFLVGGGSLRGLHSPLPVGGAPAPTETAFTLGPLHQALVPHQKDLVMLDGLSMVSCDKDPTSPANGHVQGGTHALTGAFRKDEGTSNGISIDQYIAKAINSPSPVTKVPSVELRMGEFGGSTSGITYAAPGGQLVTMEDPEEVYVRLFVKNGGVGDAAQALAKTKAERRKSVLDFVAKEMSAARPQLAAADRLKLEAHTSALRDLETRLALTGTAATCSPLEKSVTDRSYKHAQQTAAHDPNEDYLDKADVASRLMTSIFSCDLTRVGVLNLPGYDGFAGPIGFKQQSFGCSDPHDFVHKTSGTKPALGGNPDAMAMARKHQTLQAEIFANLIGYLKGIPDGDGATLFDNTVILFCGQIADGDHTTDHLPWILAGSAGGAIKTGRYLAFPKMKDAQGKEQDVPHNNLFVSLAQAMDVPTQSFGEPTVCTGPLAGLVG